MIKLNEKIANAPILKAEWFDAKSNKELKAFESKEKDGTVLLAIPTGTDRARLYEGLKTFLSVKQTNYNVDAASFLGDFEGKEKEYAESRLIDAIEEASTVAFSMKTINVKPEPQINLDVTGASKNVEEAVLLAKTKTFVRSLQDSPSNITNPLTLTEAVKTKFANLKNVKISVLTHEEMVTKKMGLITGVGQQSGNSRLVTIEYVGNPESKERLAYVGKGVCYDTGGYSLKPSSAMRNMKYDMSGSAIVAGALYAIASMNIKANVIGVLGLVENLIGGEAIRPDDILVSYAGKTVEIDNTDAEGRLVLADAVTYACRDLKASRLVTVATLTGAIMIALGHTFSGAFATDDSDWSRLQLASQHASEAVWRMPFHPDYRKLLDTRLADIVNSTDKRLAGSSLGAEFIKEFAEDRPFIHLDIAGTADIAGRGTGAIMRTLVEFAKTA